MKFIHISDLHIGKKINGFSMLEDQHSILNQILDVIKINAPACLLICGDIYDKADPSAGAVALFSSFLTSAAATADAVFIISGNHDSPQRLSFGAQLMQKSNVYISPVFNGKITHVTLTDDFGKINIYMLPFINRVVVNQITQTNPQTTNDALKTVLSSLNINKTCRNILLSHQFVTGALRSDSETIFVGDTDNVDASLYAPFDYTALGHIHAPQSITPSIRYCGTPLKYSFSEVKHKKSVTIAELREKGTLKITTSPLIPIHDLRCIKNSYYNLTLRKNYINTNTEDYLQITLTDKTPIPDAIGRLRTIYPNIMQLNYQAALNPTQPVASDFINSSEKSPLTYFDEFFTLQNGAPLTEEQRKYITDLIKSLQGE